MGESGVVAGDMYMGESPMYVKVGGYGGGWCGGRRYVKVWGMHMAESPMFVKRGICTKRAYI